MSQRRQLRPLTYIFNLSVGDGTDAVAQAEQLITAEIGRADLKVKADRGGT